MIMSDTEKERKAARRALIQNGNDLANDAMDTAPYLEGELEGDIKPTKRVTERRGVMETEVHGGTGHSRNYAVRMHESMLPAMPVGDRQFRPGPATAARPGNPWGPAGGKYLTRPLLYNMKDYTKNIAKKIKAVR